MPSAGRSRQLILPGGAVKVFAVMLVRNEQNIISHSIYNALNILGVDKILVGDNASDDNTQLILQTIAEREKRLIWTDAGREYHQAELVNGLAAEAMTQGADWIFPLDADEFPICGMSSESHPLDIEDGRLCRAAEEFCAFSVSAGRSYWVTCSIDISGPAGMLRQPGAGTMLQKNDSSSAEPGCRRNTYGVRPAR